MSRVKVPPLNNPRHDELLGALERELLEIAERDGLLELEDEDRGG